jgi:hypothetical protein
MKLWGLEWSALDSYFQFVEQASSPGTPESNHIRLYAKDNGSSVSTLCYKNDAGTEVCMPTSGSFVTGTGVVNRLTYWTGTSTLDDVPRTFTAGSVLFAHTDFLPQEDNANFFWDNTDNRLGLGTALPSQRLHVAGNALIQGAGTDVVLDVRGTANNLLNISETGTTALYKFAATGNTNAFLSCADNFIVQIDSDANSSGDVFLVKHDAVSTGGTSLFSVSETGDVSACLPGGNLIIGGGATASRLRLLEASGSGTNYTEFVVQPQASNITYTLPADDGDAGEQLQTNGSGTLSWEAAGGTNALLDGSAHTDTVAQTVSRGSLIYGNATPKWDELVVGSAGAFLRNDGTDAMWSTLTLPNAATSTRVVFASAANTYGESADVTYDGTDFGLGSGKRFRMQSQNRIRYLNSITEVYKTSAQSSIAVNTWTSITHEAEEIDTDAIHDTGSNTERLTVPLTGKWLFTGNVYLDYIGTTTAPTAVGLRIIKNGSTAIVYADQSAAADTTNQNSGLNFTAIISMTATDYVEMQGIVLATSGTFAITDIGSLRLTRFGGYYIGE